MIYQEDDFAIVKQMKNNTRIQKSEFGVYDFRQWTG